MPGHERKRRWLAVAASLAFVLPAVLTACDDDPLFEQLPDPPGAPTNVSVTVLDQDATVSWTPGPGATSQVVEITPAGGTAEVRTFNDNVTSTTLFEALTPASYTAVVTAINAGGETASSARSFTVQPPITAPTLDAFGEAEGDRTTLVVDWTVGEGADDWDIVLTPDDGSDAIEDRFPAASTSAAFGPPTYVILDQVTYTAQVFPVRANARVEEEGSNTSTFLANTHDWDTYFPTSLHETGAGKPWFYGTDPNDGFQQFALAPYEDLSCNGCHSSASGRPPVNGRTCDRCHAEVKPEIGATIEDAAVCLGCHSRQNAEITNFTDVHRDAGFGCMDCHSSEEMHGDGSSYNSILESPSPKCEDCHTSVAANTYHSVHGATVDCSVCHTQGVPSCYNCHFEAEFDNPGSKIFYGQFRNWLFLVNADRPNREPKVEVANFQALAYDGNTFIGMAPYYSHTISRDAVTGCGDCHGNEAVTEWLATDAIDVVSFDSVGAELVLTRKSGVIPVPPNYAEGGMIFDFVSQDEVPAITGPGPQWYLLQEGGPDVFQLLYGTPLTADQMDALQ